MPLCAQRRPRPRSPLVTALLLTIVFAACRSQPDQPAWGGTIDTLPDGAVLVTNPTTGGWDSSHAWRLEEELVIGDSGSDGSAMLSEVSALEVGPDGRIYVAEGMRSAVMIFDSAGNLMKSFGRDGDGPGEFRHPNGLGWDSAGRLWVVEGPSMRNSVFDDDGNFIEVHRRRTGGYGYIWQGAFLANGTMLELVHGSDPPGQSTMYVARFDSLRGMVDSLRLPYVLTGENNFKLEHANGYSVMGIPYYPSFWNWIDPRGFVWTGRTDSYELVQLSMTGDTIRVIRKEYTPLPVTGGERDSAIAQVEKVAQGASFDAGRIPRTKPALIRMLADDEGYVFVLAVEPGGRTGTRFDVFDPEGRYLGQIQTARNIGPWRAMSPVLVRGGRMYGVVVDDVDVPRIVRWRVKK